MFILGFDIHVKWVGFKTIPESGLRESVAQKLLEGDYDGAICIAYEHLGLGHLQQAREYVDAIASFLVPKK